MTDLISMLMDIGYEVDIATNIEQELVSNATKEHIVPFSRNPLKITNLAARKSLKMILKEGNYDVIHCHTPVASMILRSINIDRKRTKIIYTAHGFHFYKGAPFLNWLVYYPIELLLSHRTDLLITINKEDYEIASRRLNAKSVKQINGVGVKFRNNHSNKSDVDLIEIVNNRLNYGLKYIMSIGELNRNKNHQLVFKAIARLNDASIHYLICGVGPLEKELKALAKELGISDQIHLLGYKNNVQDYLEISDIFVFSSIREGLPVSLMEAMIVGVPIITTKVRGSIDLIENDRNGIIVDYDDSMVADAIAQLLSNPEKRESLVSESKIKIIDFELNNVNSEMLKIYAEYANEKS